MKKFIIALAVGAFALTGFSSTANAWEGGGEQGTDVTITCDDVPFRVFWTWVDADDVAGIATGIYGDVFDAISGAVDEDGNIDLNGGAPGGLVHVVITGDADGGTITITDEGVVIASASLEDGEFSFNASLEVGEYLSLHVSFFKDRLGELCGDAPFTVCLDNTIYLVEAADLADYLADNETALVVNASVGCPGLPGAPGANGLGGADGADGADGAPGAPGVTTVIEKIVTVPAAAPVAAAPVALPRTA